VTGRLPAFLWLYFHTGICVLAGSNFCHFLGIGAFTGSNFCCFSGIGVYAGSIFKCFSGMSDNTGSNNLLLNTVNHVLE
jgi:hypothetical protein